MLVFAGALWLRADDKTDMREIGAAFEKIEREYKDWPHYEFRSDHLRGNAFNENHVWKSHGDEGYVRVETIGSDVSRNDRTQFFLKGGQLFFSIIRLENFLNQADSHTAVSERRYFFARGRLVHILGKTGDFPPGSANDMSTVKAIDLPLDNGMDLSPVSAYAQQQMAASGVIAKAKLLDDALAGAETAPALPANAEAKSIQGLRVIAGSGSRDGVFALAWGRKDRSATGMHVDAEGSWSIDPGDKKLINCIVNLNTRKVIGEIDGRHSGDKASFEELATEAAWSIDSKYVAQINNSKGITRHAKLYVLTDGLWISQSTDLLQAVSVAVIEHLKSKDGDVSRKLKKGEVGLALQDPRIIQRGIGYALQVGVFGQETKSQKDLLEGEITITFLITPGSRSGAPVLSWVSTEVH